MYFVYFPRVTSREKTAGLKDDFRYEVLGKSKDSGFICALDHEGRVYLDVSVSAVLHRTMGPYQ